MDDLNIFIKKISQGVVKYQDPRSLNLKSIDKDIRNSIENINKSKWCWTVWSCQGHINPDHSVLPYITFIVKTKKVNDLLNLVYKTLPFYRDEKFPLCSGVSIQVIKGFSDHNFTVLSIYWSQNFLMTKASKKRLYSTIYKIGKQIRYGI
jgi:hypothetical protein